MRADAPGPIAFDATRPYASPPTLAAFATQVLPEGVQFIHANAVGALVLLAVSVTGVPTTGKGVPEVMVHAGEPAAGGAERVSGAQNATGRYGLPEPSIT